MIVFLLLSILTFMNVIASDDPPRCQPTSVSISISEEVVRNTLDLRDSEGVIPPTPEDKQFVLTKKKIAAAVTIATALISGGIALGIAFAQCETNNNG